MSSNPYQSSQFVSECTDGAQPGSLAALFTPLLINIPIVSLFGGVVFAITFAGLEHRLNLAESTAPTAGIIGLLVGGCVAVAGWAFCQAVMRKKSGVSIGGGLNWGLAPLGGVLVSPVAFWVSEQAFHEWISHWKWLDVHPEFPFELGLALAAGLFYGIILATMQIILSFRGLATNS